MDSESMKKLVWERLTGIMDPELNVSIVELGLVHKVQVKSEKLEVKSTSENSKVLVENKGRQQGWQIDIEMTLTTPGCPLAGTFQFMVWDSLRGIEGLDPEEDVKIELTFDPPWSQEMMSDELKAQFGVGEW